MDVEPVDEPGPPLSCVALQLLNTSMELTTSAVDGMSDSELEVLALTVMEIDVTHEAPFGPQALTCSVCAPVEDESDLLMD
jgi:hypothetical protein